MAIIYSAHSLKRIFQRQLALDVIARVLTQGEVIMSYPDDQPYPSRLVLGWDSLRPVHVVAATNEDGDTIVVTAYIPDATLWDSSFKRKLPS